MKKHKDIFSLYAFYSIYFVSLGFSSFSSKYFGEIGMTDAEIGMLTSVPAIIGIFLQPIWGSVADRVRLKKMVLVVAALGGGAAYILTGFTVNFWLVLCGMTFAGAMMLPISPVIGTIALEHVAEHGGSFGSIRMSGTVGYQVGALVLGFLLAASLKGLFQIMGVVILISGAVALFLPAVQGHQHGKEKVSYRSLIQDKRIMMLMGMLLVAETAQQFLMSFFGKRLGDLGISNDIAGVITVISIMLEIPFLLVGERFYKKLSIWQWLMVGFGCNVVRLLLLGFADTVPLIILGNLTSVSVVACYEFYPALYLNEHTRPELKASAQSMLNLVQFGLAKVTGSLIGGFLCQQFGMTNMFLFNAIMLGAVMLFFVPICQRITAEDKKKQA